MKPVVRKAHVQQEYYFQEGCFITEVSNSAEDMEMSAALVRVEPGNTTRWHRLAGTTERYLMLKGEGLVEIGDQPPTPVVPGDVVIIPADCRQRITNTGTQDLEFWACCTPRFEEKNYCDLESESS